MSVCMYSFIYIMYIYIYFINVCCMCTCMYVYVVYLTYIYLQIYTSKVSTPLPLIPKLLSFPFLPGGNRCYYFRMYLSKAGLYINKCICTHTYKYIFCVCDYKNGSMLPIMFCTLLFPLKCHSLLVHVDQSHSF